MKKLSIKLFQILVPLLIFCGVLLILWSLIGKQHLGHDEAVYLTKARSWIEGTPADEFGIYHPIGLAGFGWVFLHLGYFEVVVRIFGAIFGSFTMLFLYMLFNKLFNNWVAIAVVIVAATSYLFLQQAPLFLNDVPSSGFMFAILYLLYVYYETEGESKTVYFIAPLTALSFYIRYGTITTIGIIWVISIIMFFAQSSTRKKINYSRLKDTVFVSFLLLSPHFIYSFITLKDPLAILILAGKVAGRKYFGEGLVNYINWLPHELGGWVFGLTAIAGIITLSIIAIAIVLHVKNIRQPYLNLLWVGTIGLISFIITGLSAHAESRYVFFPVVLLSGVGIASTYYLIHSWSKVIPNLLLALFLLVVGYVGVIHYWETIAFFKSKETDRYRNAYVRVSRAILNDGKDNNGCAIWAITTYRPAVSWYSKCNTLPISDVDTFKKNLSIYSDKALYSIVLTKLNEPQVNPDQASKYGITLTEVFRTNNLTHADRGDLVVYRITENAEDNQGYDWINW